MYKSNNSLKRFDPAIDHCGQKLGENAAPEYTAVSVIFTNSGGVIYLLSLGVGQEIVLRFIPPADAGIESEFPSFLSPQVI